jgi:hypothetical protein
MLFGRIQFQNRHNFLLDLFQSPQSNEIVRFGVETNNNKELRDKVSVEAEIFPVRAVRLVFMSRHIRRSVSLRCLRAVLTGASRRDDWDSPPLRYADHLLLDRQRLSFFAALTGSSGYGL